MDLSICIVNWNTGNLLRDCVKSIIKTTQTITYEIIIIDNASDDNSLELLRTDIAEDSRILIVEAERNLGFAGGNNLAITYSSGRFLVLLNPDTIVTPGALQKAVQILDGKSCLGVLGPKLLNLDGSLQPSIGQFPTLSGMFWEMTRLRILFPRVKIFSSFKRVDMDYDLTQEVEQPSGACLFVRKSTINEVGLLDLRYFMYYEEVDWCFRIYKAGWNIIYTPDIKITHLGGQSSNKNLNVRIVENGRSKIRFFEKHYGSRFGKMIILRLIIILETILKLIAIAFKTLWYPKDRSNLGSAAKCHLQVLTMAMGLRSA